MGAGCMEGFRGGGQDIQRGWALKPERHGSYIPPSATFQDEVLNTLYSLSSLWFPHLQNRNNMYSELWGLVLIYVKNLADG